MDGSGINPSSIATVNWNNATRTLTSLVSTMLNFTPNRFSVLNGSTGDLRPTSPSRRQLITVGEALANVTWTIGVWDGTTFRGGPAGASGAAVIQDGFSQATVGMAINNSGTTSGNADACGWDYQ